MESRVGQAVCDKGEMSFSRGCQVTLLSPSTGLPKWLLAQGKLAWLCCSQKKHLSMKFHCSQSGSREEPRLPDPRAH